MGSDAMIAETQRTPLVVGIDRQESSAAVAGLPDDRDRSALERRAGGAHRPRLPDEVGLGRALMNIGHEFGSCVDEMPVRHDATMWIEDRDLARRLRGESHGDPGFRPRLSDAPESAKLVPVGIGVGRPRDLRRVAGDDDADLAGGAEPEPEPGQRRARNLRKIEGEVDPVTGLKHDRIDIVDLVLTARGPFMCLEPGTARDRAAPA